MLAGGARRLVALYGVAPGTRAVVATTSDRGLEAARALQRRGVEIVAVADLREGRTDLEAEGRTQVRAAVLGGPDGGDERRVECDLLVVSGGVAPATSLLAQAGGRTAYDEARGHLPLGELPDGVLAAGSVAGAATTREPSGARAGAEAAHALGLGRRAAARPPTARPSAAPRRPCRPAGGRRRAAGSASPACARTSPRRTSTSASTRATTRSSSPSATRR